MPLTKIKIVPKIPKITPCLWFDHNAEDAVNFYISVFSSKEFGAGPEHSKIVNVTRYGKAGHEVHGMKEDTILTIEFMLNGQTFTALNGGPIFHFSEAISFQVNCETQQEIDYFWEKLSEDGDKNAQQCGWLKDKFGLSWQIVPTILSEMLRDKDLNKSEIVMKAMLLMKKIDIKMLLQVYGRPYT